MTLRNHRHHLLLFVAWVVFFSACSDPEPQPVSPKKQDSSMDMVVDMTTDLLDEQDMLVKDMLTDETGDDMALDMSPERTLTIRLVPVDWGLGDVAPSPTPLSKEIKGRTSFEVEMMWPAGVWHIQVDDGQKTWTLQGDALSGLARKDDVLVDTSTEHAASPLFSVIDESVRIRTDLKVLSVERTTPQAMSQPLGSMSSQGSVGPFFDQAIYELNTSAGDPDDVVRTLMRHLHDVNASPVRSSRGAFFLAPGQASDPAPEVRGTFTNWDPSAKTVMRRLTGRLWGRFVTLSDAHHEYKVVFNQGADWLTDRSNRHIKWDGINTHTVGNFNSVVSPARRPVGQGRMVWWPSMVSTELSNTREVYVHLPAHYDDDQATTFPTLYIHDGNESIVRSQFHEVLDQWTDASSGKAVIGVFAALPSQNVRLSEYTMNAQDARGDDYAAFIAKTLTVAVDMAFKTRPNAKSRGVTGASLGGLISFWIAINYPTVFEYTAGMSSSFFWAEDFMLKEVQRRGCQGLRYYIDSGSPNDNADVTRIMRDTLQSLGCTHHHIEQTGGRHEWPFWKARFPGVLDVFYDGYSAP